MTLVLQEHDEANANMESRERICVLLEEARKWSSFAYTVDLGVTHSLWRHNRGIELRPGQVKELVYHRDRFSDSEPCASFEDDQVRVKVLRWVLQGLS